MSESGDVGAEGQAPPQKEHADWLEIIGTVMLGIASVLIAYSTYQSQVWGGVQAKLATNSALEIVDAADDLGRADSVATLDQLLFGDYILRPDQDDADLLLSQMSEPGQVASERWFITDEARPFDGDVYFYGNYGAGLANREAAFALFGGAGEANQNGDDYVLSATITALVLFLAGVSLVLKGHLTRVILVTGSGFILAGAVVYVASLPRAGSAASSEEIRASATEAAFAEFDALVEEAALADAALEEAASAEFDALEPPLDDEELAPGEEPEADATPTADFVITEGGMAFAVYVDLLEASQSSGDLDVDFAETVARFDEEGVEVIVGPLECDEGAAEGLGLDAVAYVAAAAYFESIEDADAFAAAYEIPADDIVEVRTFCLD